MIAKEDAKYDVFTLVREEELTYSDWEDGVKITGYSGIRDYIELPEELGGKKVVAIGKEKTGETKIGNVHVLLPNTVTYIDPLLLVEYRSRKEIGFFLRKDHPHFLMEDDCLYSKDKKTLYYCFKEKINQIPVGVEYIGDYAIGFLDPGKEDRFVIPEGIKGIGVGAFINTGCVVEIPESVEEIGGYIAGKCSIKEGNKCFKIKNGCIYTMDEKILVQRTEGFLGDVLIIPDTVEEIRPYAFYGCFLKKLTLGKGVKKIGKRAFMHSQMKTIRIPDQLVELSEEAFGYEKCQSISVGKKNQHFYSDGICLFSVQKNGEKRLLKCFNTQEWEYHVPEGTTSIEPGAFAGCNAMNKLVLPKSLKSFDESCLFSDYKKCSVKELEISENVTQLRVSFNKYSYRISPGNPNYFVEDGIWYHQDGEHLEIIFAEGVSGNPVLKNAVTRIKAYAFSKCDRITGVVLSASLQYISDLAFFGCKMVELEVHKENPNYTAVDGVLYNKSMTELKFVPKLKEADRFEVPAGVTDIGMAFEDCEKIQAIVIPKSVQILLKDALLCSAKDIYFEGDIKSFWGKNVFFNEHKTGKRVESKCDDIFDQDVKIHVNSGHKGVIQYVSGLPKNVCFRKNIFLKIDGEEDFSELTKDFIIIPNDTGITIKSLLHTSALNENTEMTIPEKIGNYKVTRIANRAFERQGFTIVALPDSIEEIGEGAFYDMRNLKSINLPKSLKNVSKALFMYCESLEEVRIPEGVEEICQSAFFGCKNIKKIYVPSTVKKISDLFLADEQGEFKDLYLSESAVFVAEPQSYAETYLRAYKVRKRYFTHLKLEDYRQADYSLSEEEQKLLSYMECHTLKNGTLSVRIQSSLDENLKELIIPEKLKGTIVTNLCIKNMSSVETLHIPETVNFIEGLKTQSFKLEGHQMKTIRVDENNPNYWSDGQALYTKDKSMLIHMFDYQAQEYQVCTETKVIGEGAFGYFTNLKKIILPKDLQEIQKEAFEQCCNLEEIVGGEKAQGISNSLFYSTAYYRNSPVALFGNILLKCEITGEKRYEIPEGVTKIEDSAFSISGEAKDVLETIVIPDSVKVIGEYAFYGRKKLKFINLPEGVTQLKRGTFQGCESLEELSLPVSVNQISPEAFPVYETWTKNNKFSKIEVKEANPAYCSIDGVLYSKDGKILVHFPAKKNKRKVVIPETVEIIGEYAFYHNQNIKQVVLSGQTKVISSAAFCKCIGLEEINLEKVEQIGGSAFYGCENLRTVSLTAKEIGSSAFSGCKKVTDLSLEKTEVIQANAFSECPITQLMLPEGILEIGAGAFDSGNFETVTIPKTVLKVGGGCFSECKEITVYDTVEPEARLYTEEIKLYREFGYKEARSALVGCMGGSDYEIIVRSAKTDEIKYKVYMGFEMTNGDNQRKIYSAWGRNATFYFEVMDELFSEIKYVDAKRKVALNRLRYPERLSESSQEAYISYLRKTAKDFVSWLIYKDDMETLLFCEPFGVLKKANMDFFIEYAGEKKATQILPYLMEYKKRHWGNAKPKTPSLSVREKSLWSISKGKVGVYKGEETEVVFPEEIRGTRMTVVGERGAGSQVPPGNCKNIVSVVLPEGYTHIGAYAFKNWENLEKIILPDTLEKIGEGAFEGCTKLKEIRIPDSVVSIGANVFKDCVSLLEVKLPNQLQELPKEAFFCCRRLEKIIIPDTVHTINEYVFFGCNLSEVKLPNALTGIYGSAFAYCRKLKEIRLPDSVGWIDNTFRGCEALEKVILPERIRSIGSYAFADCTALKEIILPDSINHMGSSIFKNCTGLTKVILPKNLKEIPGYVFEDCSALEEIILPDGIEKIGNAAFKNCTNLAKIILPKTLKHIKDYAFYRCSALEKIDLPDSAIEMESRAFYGCPALKKK